MSHLTELIKAMGGWIASKGDPPAVPEVLLERDGQERWVSAKEEATYMADGWTPVQRGAPLIMTMIQPDGTRETLTVSYERNGLDVSLRRGRKLLSSRRIQKS